VVGRAAASYELLAISSFASICGTAKLILIQITIDKNRATQQNFYNEKGGIEISFNTPFFIYQPSSL
jgi:hypothetical protein